MLNLGVFFMETTTVTMPLVPAAQATPSDQLVRRIRTQAQMDVVFDNVCKLFANRQRARQDVTVQTLMLTTKAAGYNYSRDQHVGVLLFLNSVGVGDLERKNGKVVALRNIKYNLQSLGAAANNNKPAPPTIDTFKPSYGGGQFKAIIEERAKAASPRMTPPPTSQRDQSRHAPQVQATARTIKLTIDAGNGMPMTMEMPAGVDLVQLLLHLQNIPK
jgi:hypothetical protein